MADRKLASQELASRLKDWGQLNKDIMTWPEDEILQAIEYEKKSRARVRVLLRLQNRLSKLRGQRERKALLEVARG
jgi:hypothetical protein